MQFRFLSFGLIFFLAASAIFSSCEIFETDEFELNPILDCPDLQLNFGDSCELTILGAPQAFFGVLTEECECLGDTLGNGFDCPELELNFRDTCMLADGNLGIVSEECECLGGGNTFDCPDLQLNVQDSCVLANGNLGNATEELIVERSQQSTSPEVIEKLSTDDLIVWLKQNHPCGMIHAFEGR